MIAFSSGTFNGRSMKVNTGPFAILTFHSLDPRVRGPLRSDQKQITNLEQKEFPAGELNGIGDGSIRE